MAIHSFDSSNAKAFHNHFLMKYFPQYIDKSHNNFLSFVSTFNEEAFDKEASSLKDLFKDFCLQKGVEPHISRGYQVYSFGLNHRFLCAEHNAQILDYSVIYNLGDLSRMVENTRCLKQDNKGYYNIWCDGINDDNQHFGIIFTSVKQYIAFEIENHITLIHEFLNIDAQYHIDIPDTGYIDFDIVHQSSTPDFKKLKNYFIKILSIPYINIMEEEIDKAIKGVKPLYVSFSPSDDTEFIKTDIKHFIFRDIKIAESIDLVESTNIKMENYPDVNELSGLIKMINSNIKNRFWFLMEEKFNDIKNGNISIIDFSKRNK